MKSLKKLDKLKLMPEKMLPQEALVEFRGGSGGSESGCESYECRCLYIPGQWTGCYTTESQVLNAIHTYCGSGSSGYCDPI